MTDTNRNRIADHYKEASEELFIFYTSLIEAGFSNEQAFEIVRTCMNNSVIENMINSYERRFRIDRIRDMKEKLHKETKGEISSD